MSANDLNGGREPLFLETIPGQASQLTRADGTRLGSPVTATSISDGGVVQSTVDGVSVNIPVYLKPAGFSPCIIASLVVGATYAQSGTVITVTATAHGIQSTKNGRRFYWPGDANYPAQYMGNWTYVDANTFTINAPASATVSAGTAITSVASAGAAIASAIEFASTNIKGGWVSTTGKITAHMARGGDTGSGPRRTRMILGGQQISSAIFVGANLGAGNMRQTIYAIGPGKQVAMAYQDGTNDAIHNAGTVDLTQDQTLSLCVQLTAVQQHISIDACMIEIVG